MNRFEMGFIKWIEFLQESSSNEEELKRKPESSGGRERMNVCDILLLESIRQ